MLTRGVCMDDLMNAFGERLKKIRNDLNLTQDELAFECDMHGSHIGQLERGIKSPTLDTLNKIAFGLNIPLPKLVDFDTYVKPIPDDRKNKFLIYLNKLDDKSMEKAFEIIKTLAK